jgi:phosphatidylglycerophosphate synthase
MKQDHIPITLTKSRLILGPLVLILTVLQAPWETICVTLVLGVLSDIFDGVLARKWKLVTPELRVADSRADGVYSLCLVTAICVGNIRAVIAFWPWLVLLSLLEFITTSIDYKRYGKPSSHHAYSAKIWALSFFALAVAGICFHRIQPYLIVCVLLGVINNIEGYIIRALLPLWAHDVSGIPAARRLRQVQLAQIEKHFLR